MGRPQAASHAEIFLTIAGSEDVGFMFERFEWRSFINGGYVIRARIADPYFNHVRKLIEDHYLKKGRRGPTPVVFELIWPDTESTKKHLAYMTHLDSTGIHAKGTLGFIAVDPPSYWLNAGDSAGKVYKGTVKQVIEKVVNEYFIDPDKRVSGKKGKKGKVEVSETLDNQDNQWWMMRQDPKSFINSLLDWSSSITKKRTNWIVSSSGSIEAGAPTIWIKEQAERESKNYGLYLHNTATPSANDSMDTFEFLGDNFMSVFQKTLITHGISAISGMYYDRKMDEKKEIVHVHDVVTAEKKNVEIKANQGFTGPKDNPSMEKPHEWSTTIGSVPQFSAGDLGIPYKKYIDGRARQQYLSLLSLTMRIKLRVTGEASADLANSHYLGVSKLKIAWEDVDNGKYFVDGDWMVYGFEHVVDRGDKVGWRTDLFCYRLDHDAKAQKV